MEAKDFLEFGPFHADVRRRVVTRGAEVIPLPGKAFDVLLALLQNPGETVSKDQLMKAVWRDSFVEEGNLTQMVFLLRKTLGDSDSGQPFIVTVPRQGYRFVGDLTGKRPTEPPRRKVWLAVAAAVIAVIAAAGIWLSGKRSGPAISTIAVLPLQDVSPQKDQEYLCEGIADDLIEALSQIRGLRVTARSSAFLFNKKGEDVRAIGSKLGVQALLTGTVRRDGDKVRITVELVSTKDGYRLWAESYERSAGDVFAIQRAISRSVAEVLRFRTGGEDYAPPRYTSDIATYDLYLKGRSSETQVRAIEYFNEAIQRNPNYAPAYAGLADAYLLLWSAGRNPNETLPKATQAVETALKLDDRLAEAHNSKAGILSRNFDWRGALAEAERAVELAPSFGPARWRRSAVLLYTGREQEARRAFEQAEAIDPMIPNLVALKLQHLFYMRRFDETIDLAKRYPDGNNSRYYLARSFAEKGLLPEAIAGLEAARRGYIGQGFGVLSSLYVRAGRRSDALRLLEEAREMAKHVYVKPASMAQLHIGLGDFDEAFRWLDRAREEHDPTIASLRLETCWDPLRNDPRFQALLKKVNLAD